MHRGASEAKSLRLKSVSVRFAGLLALEDVSIRVDPLEVFGLIGPNGAGKTTAVNVLTGFIKPTRGSVLLGEEELTGQPAPTFAKRRIARTFQSGRLFPRMTVIDNVAVAAMGTDNLGRHAARDRAYETLDWLGCSTVIGSLACRLPHGLQQRVGIARALVGAPAFVLLDEPASGLGRQDCSELVSLIREIPARYQCGVLLIDHNMAVIMQACDRIHVLSSGRSLAEGDPKAVQQDRAVRDAYLGETIEVPKVEVLEPLR